MSRENVNIPYQIQQLLDGVQNKSESIHVRANYAMRLRTIQEEIAKALSGYDRDNNSIKVGRR